MQVRGAEGAYPPPVRRCSATARKRGGVGARAPLALLLSPRIIRAETSMGDMLNLLAIGLVLAATGVLLSALVPVGQLIRQIPAGPVRRRWYFLAALIVFFVLGYLGYLIVSWGRAADGSALIVPGTFFLGAGFVRITATLSLQAATDIRRVVLLERDTITDPLTGIYNRRYLDRRLEDECARARRYQLPLFVLLLDIDHFKRVNDAYGHPAGDEVLIYLGKLILQAVREADIVARYGGDEVLIIAPNNNLASAMALAERLRQTVETHALTLTSGPDQRQEIRITVSIGVAGTSRDMSDSRQLLENADVALYRAKQDGRNRVIAHTTGAFPHSPPGTA
jgi:diguanylate cyclase (GGDEF)-like protein